MTPHVTEIPEGYYSEILHFFLLVDIGQLSKVLPWVQYKLGRLIWYNINLAFAMLSTSVTGHGPHRLGLKAIEAKFKSNRAKPSCTRRRTSTPRPSPSKPSPSPTSCSLVGLGLG